MRFLLLVAICCLAVLASADDKKKRDILPGDPRYGTDYHHKEHSADKNEPEVTKSHGGFIGSFTVPEVNTAYGPPDYQPGKPISDGHLANILENNIDVSSPSYGLPEGTLHQKTLQTGYESLSDAAPVTSYGSPVGKVEKVENPVVPYEVPTVREISSTPSEEKVETTVIRTTSAVVPEVKVNEHLQDQKTIHKTEVKAALPTASGVAANAPPIDARFLNTDAGVFPSTDLSSFSNAGSISFNGDQAFTQPLQVGFDTTYGNLYPNFYGDQFVNPGSYDASLLQAYQLPQTIYSQQEYSPISTQYGYPIPYALSQGNLYQSNLGATQKTGPIADFVQEAFPNIQLPQLPQLPQFPQFSDLASFFQFSNKPSVTAPIDATDTDVKKRTEQKILETSDKHVVKSEPVSVSNLSKKDTTAFTKTTNEYTQPIDSNGGYIY